MKCSKWQWYYSILTFLAAKAEPGERVPDTLLEKAMMLSGFTAGRYRVSWKRSARGRSRATVEIGRVGCLSPPSPQPPPRPA